MNTNFNNLNPTTKIMYKKWWVAKKENINSLDFLNQDFELITPPIVEITVPTWRESKKLLSIIPNMKVLGFEYGRYNCHFEICQFEFIPNIRLIPDYLLKRIDIEFKN